MVPTRSGTLFAGESNPKLKVNFNDFFNKKNIYRAGLKDQICAKYVLLYSPDSEALIAADELLEVLVDIGALHLPIPDTTGVFG